MEKIEEMGAPPFEIQKARFARKRENGNATRVIGEIHVVSKDLLKVKGQVEGLKTRADRHEAQFDEIKGQLGDIKKHDKQLEAIQKEILELKQGVELVFQHDAAVALVRGRLRDLLVEVVEAVGHLHLRVHGGAQSEIHRVRRVALAGSAERPGGWYVGRSLGANEFVPLEPTGHRSSFN